MPASACTPLRLGAVACLALVLLLWMAAVRMGEWIGPLRTRWWPDRAAADAATADSFRALTHAYDIARIDYGHSPRHQHQQQTTTSEQTPPLAAGGAAVPPQPLPYSSIQCVGGDERLD